MAHIHAQIDLVVSAFIVHQSRVLLVNHKKLNTWLAVGGHVELHEDTDEALKREIMEETGLSNSEYTVWQPDQPYTPVSTPWRTMNPMKNHNSKRLLVPWAMEIHDFVPIAGHRHMALVYLAKAWTDRIRLASEEHHGIGWFEQDELDSPGLNLLDTIRTYGHEAIRAVHAFTR